MSSFAVATVVSLGSASSAGADDGFVLGQQAVSATSPSAETISEARRWKKDGKFADLHAPSVRFRLIGSWAWERRHGGVRARRAERSRQEPKLRAVAKGVNDVGFICGRQTRQCLSLRIE
ncbi:hypothetical protein PAGU2638_13140 [Lysobacter sp. PAGU 2638]